MKKFIKRATAVLSALALVVGMTAVTPKEVLAKTSVSKLYKNKLKQLKKKKKYKKGISSVQIEVGKGSKILNNGKATYTEISKYLMEKGNPVLKKYSVKNNKFKVLSSKKISRKKAGKIFFYCNSKDKIRGEIIEWKKE